MTEGSRINGPPSPHPPRAPTSCTRLAPTSQLVRPSPHLGPSSIRHLHPSSIFRLHRVGAHARGPREVCRATVPSRGLLSLLARSDAFGPSDSNP